MFSKNKEKQTETVEFQYPLGSRVRDRLTNLVGIVDCRMECLNGCLRYSVQPQLEDPTDTKIPNSWWIDEAQLELVDLGLNHKPVNKNKTGGPMESSQGAKQYV
jgi:hypothetical protein